jgi:hypothetical protein
MSSAVAAIAIVGGYFGVRSANRAAVNIAREERSAQKKYDFEALRRKTYAEGLAALSEVAAIPLLEDARKEVPKIRDIEKTLDLIAPQAIIDQFGVVISKAGSLSTRNAFENELKTLTRMMRDDLEDKSMTTEV